MMEFQFVFRVLADTATEPPLEIVCSRVCKNPGRNVLDKAESEGTKVAIETESPLNILPDSKSLRDHSFCTDELES